MKFKFLLIPLTILSLAACGEANTTQENNSNEEMTKVLWRDEEGAVILDLDYFGNISEEEKAALAYLSTQSGTDCNWGNETANEEMANLYCNLTTALQLGVQCSKEHLELVREWFSGNQLILEELNMNSCYMIPYTATIQDVIDEVRISKSDNYINLDYKATSINIRDNEYIERNKNLEFTITENDLILNDLNEAEAIDLVSQMPEVMIWKSTPNLKAAYMVVESKGNVYTVKVYENLIDHIVTFGFYSVNLDTGEIIPDLPSELNPNLP